MKYLFVLLFATSLHAQDYLQEEEMLYEDAGYSEESSSFARERSPAGYDDYEPYYEEGYETRQEEQYDEEPLYEDTEDAYYAEEELLTP